jgi:hypothetical protein
VLETVDVIVSGFAFKAIATEAVFVVLLDNVVELAVVGLNVCVVDEAKILLITGVVVDIVSLVMVVVTLLVVTCNTVD